ncbi:hypothetical protein FS837_007763 [Tulasnella sp. UAMH 9824]|nr:hypothetical protein FS837_007763 [Tulasnella sp. UAMH 9824]
MGPNLAYETENFQVGFGGIGEDAFIINSVVQEFQDLFKNPSLTVTIDERLEDVWLFLRLLNEQNVRTIVAHFKYGEYPVGNLLRVIGSISPPFPHGTMTSTAIDWPFKSLRSINIHDAYVELVNFTSLVEMYLHKSAKPLLEEIILVGCSYSGMELAEAVEKIAEIGIILRGIECDYEE